MPTKTIKYKYLFFIPDITKLSLAIYYLNLYKKGTITKLIIHNKPGTYKVKNIWDDSYYNEECSLFGNTTPIWKKGFTKNKIFCINNKFTLAHNNKEEKLEQEFINLFNLCLFNNRDMAFYDALEDENGNSIVPLYQEDEFCFQNEKCVTLEVVDTVNIESL